MSGRVLHVRERYSRWNPALKLEWSGPGVQRQEITADHFWHDPQMAKVAMSELSKAEAPAEAPKPVHKTASRSR